MASLSSGYLLFVLVAGILLLSHPVICDHDEEKSLIQGLNSYRKTQGLPALSRNDQADCLADKIADKLEKQPCTNTNGINAPPGAQPQFKDYQNLLSKCHIDNRTAANGTILPVCVPNLDINMVLSNYTRSVHAKFLNDTKYDTAGVGSEDDWMVVVLFANTTAGTTPTSPGGSAVPTPPGAAGGTATPAPGAAGGSATPSTVPAGTSANAAALVFEGSLGYGSLLLMGFVHLVIYLLS